MPTCRFQKGSFERYEYQMEIKKKPTAWGLVAALAAWELVVQPVWNLMVERFAEQNSLDRVLTESDAMTVIENLASYLPSSFAAGFVVGALIFAYWDNIVTYWRIRRHGLPKLDDRAWVANQWVNFDPQQKNFDLWITLISIGDVPLRISRVEGNAVLKAGGLTHELSNGYFVREFSDTFEKGTYVSLPIRFDLSPKVWRLLPDMFGWSNPRTYLKTKGVSIIMMKPDGSEKSVELWESMRLTTGDWQVKSVQTFPIFKDEQEKDDLKNALTDALEIFKPNENR